MALTALRDTATRSFAPRWPIHGVDPTNAWADYDPVVDELLVYFGQPSGGVSVPIDTPERDFVYLVVDEETEAVVGIQVDALGVWVSAAYPRWAPLMDRELSPELRSAAIAALVTDAAGLAALYGAGAGEP